MTSILFALSPQVQSLHHHLVHFISRRWLSMHHGARPHLLRAICRRKDGLTVGDGVPPFLAPPSQRAAIFGWREIRNADQRPARSCARLLDLGPHRQSDRAIIETSERELRDPLAAFAHLVSRTLAPLSRSEQSAARIRSYRPHAGPLSMPMPQTDTEGVRVGERQFMRRRNQTLPTSDVTKTYWGLAASAQSVAIMTETRSLHFSLSSKGATPSLAGEVV